MHDALPVQLNVSSEESKYTGLCAALRVKRNSIVQACMARESVYPMHGTCVQALVRMNVHLDGGRAGSASIFLARSESN